MNPLLLGPRKIDFMQEISICCSPCRQKELVAKLSNNLSMDKHVTNTRRPGACIALLDNYCIILCYQVLPNLSLTNSMQKVHNSAVRLVFKAHKQKHVKLFLQKLQRLRIQFKISTLCAATLSLELALPAFYELLTA